MKIDKTKDGWDAQLVNDTAKKFGGLKECFEAHGWPERGNKMMTSLPTHVVDNYGSIENFAVTINVINALVEATGGSDQ